MKAIIGMIAVAVICGSGAIPALAQDAGDRSTDQVTCKEVMRESGSSRDVAIGFIHGIFLGKSGGTNFNVAALQKQTDAFMERCLDNPNEKAMDAMAKVKN